MVQQVPAASSTQPISPGYRNADIRVDFSPSDAAALRGFEGETGTYTRSENGCSDGYRGATLQGAGEDVNASVIFTGNRWQTGNRNWASVSELSAATSIFIWTIAEAGRSPC